MTSGPTIFSKLARFPFSRLFHPASANSNYTSNSSSSAVVDCKSVAAGIYQFSADFYNAAKKADGGTSRNWVFSPFSLSAAFAMLKVGTRGDTSSQLEKAFYYAQNNDVALATGFRSIIQTVNGVESSRSPDFKITSANRLYIDNKFEVLPTYLDIVQNHFGSGIERLKLNPAAASVINKWVENVTHDKIRDLIAPMDLNDKDPWFRPTFVLINAIYILGKWQHQFHLKNTREQPFFLSEKDDDAVMVKMMHQDLTLQVAYLKDIDADCFLLPYKGGRFSMLVVLPRTKGGLFKVESNLKSIPSLSQLGPQLRASEVNLAFPKFKIETTIDATSILPQMGVTLIFSEGEGDFTGIIGIRKDDARLKVSKAVQKAVIIVDEYGTEATAATSTIGGWVVDWEPPCPQEIIVDHPFYYQIVDQNSDLILFAGSCTNPTQTN